MMVVNTCSRCLLANNEVIGDNSCSLVTVMKITSITSITNTTSTTSITSITCVTYASVQFGAVYVVLYWRETFRK